MGWRFRKSFKVAPGVRLNVSKKGISTSIGPKGAKINIGPSGTRFTASIPGTGLSYTTRLDKPISKSMTQCPYCGHKMRKRWDNCPKCHQPLIKKVEEPQKNASNTEATDNNTTYDTNTNTSNISVADNKNKANNVEPGCYGCGCLVVIIIFILFLIGSCASGTKEAYFSRSGKSPVTDRPARSFWPPSGMPATTAAQTPPAPRPVPAAAAPDRPRRSHRDTARRPENGTAPRRAP